MRRSVHCCPVKGWCNVCGGTERREVMSGPRSKAAATGEARVSVLCKRVSALSEHQQSMLLYLLVGSNPADVERELATLLGAISGVSAPVLGQGGTE